MRRAFGAILAACVTLCCAFAASAQGIFDARALGYEEKRYLQAALALEGTYQGRLDGAWGNGSQRALTKALTDRDLGQDAGSVGELLRDLDRALREGRWNVMQSFGGGMSFIAPSAKLEMHERRQDPADLASASGDLKVRSFMTPEQQTQEFHRRARPELSNPYTVNRRDFAITSGRLPDGSMLYMRSQRVRQTLFSTVLVQWKPSAAASGRLIVASVQPGRQAMLAPGNGALRAAMRAEPRPPVADDPSWDPWNDNPAPTPQPTVTRAGVGFYINNTDFLVPRDAVGRCRSGLRVAGGRNVRAVRTQPLDDLVLMTSGRRSEHWLPLSNAGLRNAPPRADAVIANERQWDSQKGRVVRAELIGAGFGLFGGENRALARVTGGDGALGSPLLDSSGRVFGVAIGAPGDSDLGRILGQTPLGELSVVVGTSTLGRSLAQAGILFVSSRLPGALYKLDTSQALVALSCR